MSRTFQYAIIRTEWKNGLAFRVVSVREYQARGEKVATVTSTSQAQVAECLKQWLDDGIPKMLRELNKEDQVESH